MKSGLHHLDRPGIESIITRASLPVIDETLQDPQGKWFGFASLGLTIVPARYSIPTTLHGFDAVIECVIEYLSLGGRQRHKPMSLRKFSALVAGDIGEHWFHDCHAYWCSRAKNEEEGTWMRSAEEAAQELYRTPYPYQLIRKVIRLGFHEFMIQSTKFIRAFCELVDRTSQFIRRETDGNCSSVKTIVEHLESLKQVQLISVELAGPETIIDKVQGC